MNNAVFGILLAAGCAGILISFGRARSRAVFHMDGFTDPPRRVAAIALLGVVLLLTVAIPFAGGLAGGARETRDLTVVSLFAVHAILVAFLFFYWALSRHEPVLDFLKLRSAQPAKDLVSGFFIGTAGWLLTILALLAFVLVWMLFNRGATPISGGINPTVLWVVSRPLAVRIAIVVSAMVVEELFFRSFLQTRVGPLAATLMFTAAHGVYGQPLVLIGIFVISAVLSAAYALYGNVLPCIVAHGVFDAIQMFVLIPFSLKQLGGA
jgi:membrane protease YdiL (CAAX protease family)